MKDKAPIIVLIIVAIGLAVGLIVVNNKATEQKKDADSKIEVLSNSVVSTRATLVEYQGVNQTLETNLAATKTEFSNKLALSEATLHTISQLDTQIATTQKKLAESQGDRTLLLAELKRLQAQHADLERKFNDLAALRLQVRKLKQEVDMARQLDWMRRGVYAATGEKGGEHLMQHGTNAAAPANADLSVELRQQGGVKIQSSSSTNSPPK